MRPRWKYAQIVVDAVIDPWGFVVTGREARMVSAGRWAGRIADIGANADLLDANVIRTADPYAQARLLFLQTRRYHLGIETEDDFIDPYAFLD
jgi:phospholipid-binding lipoprotein MlaA